MKSKPATTSDIRLDSLSLRPLYIANPLSVSKIVYSKFCEFYSKLMSLQGKGMLNRKIIFKLAKVILFISIGLYILSIIMASLSNKSDRIYKKYPIQSRISKELIADAVQVFRKNNYKILHVNNRVGEFETDSHLLFYNKEGLLESACNISKLGVDYIENKKIHVYNYSGYMSESDMYYDLPKGFTIVENQECNSVRFTSNKIIESIECINNCQDRMIKVVFRKAKDDNYRHEELVLEDLPLIDSLIIDIEKLSLISQSLVITNYINNENCLVNDVHYFNKAKQQQQYENILVGLYLD